MEMAADKEQCVPFLLQHSLVVSVVKPNVMRALRAAERMQIICKGCKKALPGYETVAEQLEWLG